MPRTVAASRLDEGIAGFRAEVLRLALALVEKVLADEVARWQAAMPKLATEARAAALKPRRSKPAR